MKKNVIFFGAGTCGKNLLKKVDKRRVAYFADNNTSIIGEQIEGIYVIGFSEVCRLCRSQNYEVVITSDKYYLEMAEQLMVAKIDNYYNAKEFMIAERFLDSTAENRILLLNTHVGTNIGDHLISEAEVLFFEKYFPEKKIVEISADMIDENFEIVSRYIDSRDVVTISGGGYMGSLWPIYGENNVRRIVAELPNNRIIVLPQSIFYENSTAGIEYLSVSQKIFNSHNDLLICSREPDKYDYIRSLYDKKVRICTFPDMALFVKTRGKSIRKNKVGVCFRRDKESILSDVEKNEIIHDIDGDTVFFDMHADFPLSVYERKMVVEEYISMISEFKYVITDRLHCLILCALTGTRCIAINNITNKLSGVCKWIEDSQNIHLVNSFSEARDECKLISVDENYETYKLANLDDKFAELALLFQE